MGAGEAPDWPHFGQTRLGPAKQPVKDDGIPKGIIRKIEKAKLISTKLKIVEKWEAWKKGGTA